jgi:hypothetical protein
MDKTKPQLQQVTNYLAALVTVVGNSLPYVTPDLLVSLGLTAVQVHVGSIVVAALLAAYQEKQKPAPLPPLPVPSTQEKLK